MKACVLYYEGFCEFEVVFTFLYFKNNIFSVALENKAYTSIENQKYLPDKTIEELNIDEIDLFIIPGGNPEHLYENQRLKEFITALNEKNKYIAAICGGVWMLGSYGILNNKSCTGDSEGIVITESNKHIIDKATVVEEDVVIDGNLITSKGKAFAEFALELGKLMKVFESEEDAIENYNWMKNIK